MTEYEQYVAGKLALRLPTGIDGDVAPREWMFPHQNDLFQWACHRGRCAVFADTGLGKTRIQIAWADEIAHRTGSKVLILAPLAVAEQTAKEGDSVGVRIRISEGGPPESAIEITNYEKLHKLEPSAYGGVVLDESSIIKHHDAKTLRKLMDSFRATPFRLCCSATPAPNDWTELGTHAEFLGVCKRSEMLSEYFVHDGGETQVWRLKGHARRDFWRWVSSWGAMVRKPSDLGYSDDLYLLPELSVLEHVCETKVNGLRTLFPMEAKSLMDRRRARSSSVSERSELCASLVNASDDRWVVWCDLNSESKALADSIRGSCEIRGSDHADEKRARLIGFTRGDFRVLVTKPSIAGHGMNWQHCARMAFVGLSDSYEAYYQAVRRCWRFGQTRPVEAHIFYAPEESSVVANVKRKEAAYLEMAGCMAEEMNEFVRADVASDYARQTGNDLRRDAVVDVPAWIGGKRCAA